MSVLVRAECLDRQAQFIGEVAGAIDIMLAETADRFLGRPLFVD